MKAKYDAGWDEATAALRRAMKTWRDGHPQATFIQIEEALESELSKLRAEMLSDMANASAAAEGATGEGERVGCPQCGSACQRHGHRQRTLTGPQDQGVRLERRALTCVRCGHTFFPSGH